MRRTPPSKLLRHTTALAVTGVVLAACANPFADDAPTLNDILSGGWIGLRDGEAPIPAARAAAPLYCYGTIGREDCYEAPLATEEGRLIGFQGPPPQARDDL